MAEFVLVYSTSELLDLKIIGVKLVYLKAVPHSHDFHRSSSAIAEKSQIAVFVRDPRGLFPISGPQ